MFKTESKKLKQSLCDHILTVCSIFLERRSQINGTMSLKQLKTVFTKTLSFLQNVENVASTAFYSIRGVLVDQAKAFLANFHKEKKKKLNDCLCKDMWTPVCVLSHVTQFSQRKKRKNSIIVFVIYIAFFYV